MADVYIGVDRRLGRRVAVKVLRVDRVGDETFQARFRREGESVGGLSHPCIVAVYDTGEDFRDGVIVPYIVMEYAEGQTVREVLDDDGRQFAVRDVLQVCVEVLDALDYSHRAGIVHRDIKPANVMLTRTGDVKVMDFGIARSVGSTTLTQTASVVGTAQYFSPEQACGGSVDGRSDIYSTGCLLYEMLTGRPPFLGDSLVEVAMSHVWEEPLPPSAHEPGIPAEVDAVTLMALRKRPDDRYQTASEMGADLRRALSGQPVTAALPGDRSESEPMGDSNLPGPSGQIREDRIETKKGRTGGGRSWAAVLALMLVLVLAMAGFLALQAYTSSANEVAVPTVIGQSKAATQRLLGQSRLRLGAISWQRSATVPKGRVLAQNPPQGDRTRVNTAVDITVSGGKPNVRVPNVVGTPLAQARARLAGEGFAVRARVDHTSTRPAGEVTGIDPAQGLVVPADTQLTLSYSTGQIPVPDVLQMSQDHAMATLHAAGFAVDATSRRTTEAQPGTVVAETPTAGTRRRADSTVRIVIARHPAPKPSPSPSRSPSPDPPPPIINLPNLLGSL